MSNTALLIVDVQNEARNRCVNFNSLIDNLKKLIAYCQEKNITVIYTKNYVTKKYSQRFGSSDWCARGTKEYEIPEEIKPQEGDIVIEKAEYSSFFGTNLNDVLKEKGIKILLLAGLQAHVCLQCTSTDAFYNDYDVIAIKECISSTDSEKLEQGLRWIEKFTGSIKSIEDIISN